MINHAHCDRVQSLLETTPSGPLKFRIESGVVVAPLTFLKASSGTEAGQFDGGVYASTGEVITSGLHRKNGLVNNPRAFSDLGQPEPVSGFHVFGGLLKDEHWGHFITESLARLWVLPELVGHEVSSVVFYTRTPNVELPRFARDMFDLLMPGVNITLVRVPTQFETLCVPEMAGHPEIGFLYGNEQVRKGFEGMAKLPASSEKRVYVSRSKLASLEGGIVGEGMLERSLADWGYVTIHPQEMSLKEQVAAYTGADKLIFAEGSAIHLFAMVCRPDQKAFIIRRRQRSAVFDWQIATFGGALHGQDHIQYHIAPVGSQNSLLRAKAVLDFDSLQYDLEASGMLPSRQWIAPSDLDAALEREMQTHVMERLHFG